MKTVAKASDLKGVFTALFTPLVDDDPTRLRNSIDHAKAGEMIDDLIALGVTGLVPVGTTGQSPTLSHEQHVDFIAFVVDYVAGRVPVIAGAGSNCTRESVEMIDSIQRTCGELACLCVTGYYNNPPQEGLVRHYETVARETDANLILYNIPGRTASYLEPATLVKLARIPNIIGLKQAVDFGAPGRYRDDTARVIAETDPSEFAVLSGEDDIFVSLLGMGGVGIISASANIPEVAKAFLGILAAWGRGDRGGAEGIEKKILPVIETVFLRKNPIPLGAFFNSQLYLPLVDLRETDGGGEAYARVLEVIETELPSLRKYHAGGAASASSARPSAGRSETGSRAGRD
jgi:4-hydroxy-tetrahydrodipicolinate synthase